MGKSPMSCNYPKWKRPLPSHKVEYFWYSELKIIYTSSIVNVLLLRGKLSLPEGCQVTKPISRWRLWTQNAGNLSWAASRVASWPSPWPQGGRPGLEARLSGVLVGRYFTRKRTRIRTLFGLQIGGIKSLHPISFSTTSMMQLLFFLNFKQALMSTSALLG